MRWKHKLKMFPRETRSGTVLEKIKARRRIHIESYCSSPIPVGYSLSRDPASSSPTQSHWGRSLHYLGRVLRFPEAGARRVAAVSPVVRKRRKIHRCLYKPSTWMWGWGCIVSVFFFFPTLLFPETALMNTADRADLGTLRQYCGCSEKFIAPWKKKTDSLQEIFCIFLAIRMRRNS